MKNSLLECINMLTMISNGRGEIENVQNTANSAIKKPSLRFLKDSITIRYP